jgi:hypothetical protein
MKRLLVAAVCLALLGFAGVVRAADKPNPTGTWKWKIMFGGEERELAVKLKQEGDKLTGVFIGPDNNETKIEDGKYKDGDVSFTVNREFNGNKISIKYHGKVDGDTIKGKSEIERDGETRTRDWEAKRAKD